MKFRKFTIDFREGVSIVILPPIIKDIRRTTHQTSKKPWQEFPTPAMAFPYPGIAFSMLRIFFDLFLNELMFPFPQFHLFFRILVDCIECIALRMGVLPGTFSPFFLRRTLIHRIPQEHIVEILFPAVVHFSHLSENLSVPCAKSSSKYRKRHRPGPQSRCSRTISHDSFPIQVFHDQSMISMRWMIPCESVYTNIPAPEPDPIWG